MIQRDCPRKNLESCLEYAQNAVHIGSFTLSMHRVWERKRVYYKHLTILNELLIIQFILGWNHNTFR
jgi:hypothetical protein